MEPNGARIGLSLSGGGIRATIFHLGVLKYLAEAGLFDQIVSLSSVSGASLCVGAIIAANDNKWPGGKVFLRSVLPSVREMILHNDIQKSALIRLAFFPRYWWNRVELIAKMLEKKWNVRGTLQDMPEYPYWEINCTTFETGKNFRIRRDFMGDYSVGYTQKPGLPISHMMAASAGFPVLIGPYILKTQDMRWTKDKWGRHDEIPVDSMYSLWDGGVYDNLGLEALYKIGIGLDSEIDFLMVSNASASISRKERRGNLSVSNMMRLMDITTSQIETLRTREVFASVISQGMGMYFKIGADAEKIAQGFGVSRNQAGALINECLSPDDARLCSEHPTTLRTPSQADFDRILRHGYENAKCVHIFGEISRKPVFS